AGPRTLGRAAGESGRCGPDGDRIQGRAAAPAPVPTAGRGRTLEAARTVSPLRLARPPSHCTMSATLRSRYGANHRIPALLEGQVPRGGARMPRLSGRAVERSRIEKPVMRSWRHLVAAVVIVAIAAAGCVAIRTTERNRVAVQDSHRADLAA